MYSVSGTSTKSAYVGCVRASAPKIAANARRLFAKKSAIAAGTSSWRAAVPGSDSVAHDPPCPGPKQKTASVRVSSDDAPATCSEDREARLVGDGAGERHEQRRLVAHDHAGIDAREPGDEGEQLVPERERVAGVQTTVLELVDAAQVEGCQVDELADARFVEEAVARDGAFDVPEQPPEDDAEPEPDSRTWSSWFAPRTRFVVVSDGQRNHEDDREHRDGEVDRAVQREHRGPRDEDRGHRPGQHRRRAALSERTCDRPAGRHDAERAEGEAEVDDHGPEIRD